jgi:hypothetical protein
MISDTNTVLHYCHQHAELMGMLANIQEFVATMPAPNENGEIKNIDYGYIGSIDHIHSLLCEASEIADEMSGH